MVKNAGGNKCKGGARKHSIQPESSSKLRLPESSYEIFAQVTSLLGNNMAYVMDEFGKTRLLHIRGKFRTRGRRDNTIAKGKWVLAGKREFETEVSEAKLLSSSSKKKFENCDLLEVYNDSDKHRLTELLPSKSGVWKLFQSQDTSIGGGGGGCALDESVIFADEDNSEYKIIMTKKSVALPSADESEDEFVRINVDDI
jgi:hypothetical protein